MKKSLTLRYCLHQFAYWGASAGIISFATAFLLEKGFPASQVGVLLACGSVLSGVTQPVLAAVADRARGSALTRMMTGLTVVCAICFSLLLLPGLPKLLFGALYLAGVWFFDSMIPLMNAVSVYYNERGWKINYGIGRSAGSLSYAVAALGLGYVIEGLGPDWMIRIVLLLFPVCIVIVLGFPKAEEKAREIQMERELRQEPCSPIVFFSRYRWYCLSLVGISLLAMFHSMTENYLIAIMQRLGGDSRHVGVALFVATVVEGGVFIFFQQILQRVGNHWLMRLAAFSFLLKAVLFLVAPNIPFVYAAQLLQMTSYAFLSPTQVYYADEKVAPQDMVKGQAFITASYTLGCALGNFAGGQLMERFGIVTLMQAGVAIAAAGTLVLLLTVEKKDSWLKEKVGEKYGR